jgi:ABC-2 type transport system ATP-binding protein
VVVGRGKVIADTSVAELIAAASGGRVLLRTAAGDQAAAVLAGAGATVAVAGTDMVTVTGLPAEKVVALLAAARVPFAEISVHRASLEEAYLELTAGAVEFRAAEGPRAGADAGTGPGAGEGPRVGTGAGR